ncbi:ABC transporter ATP-binding protein [Sporosarcina sp. Te-1]|uniref:ABC transporter ATP-binding protein n=1 Tax=Sporosarcina sp. Te-1 TaxID=2818390 RepID=UPI001A9E05D0|nr:ABC transporter ATP-binding protein [Sporosarcina sp. Te-1]QTD41025.1 ABC transporter ATP-binding protein [Sporosarcina sp. Te-1]
MQVELRDLSMEFQDVIAVNRLNLTIEQGKLVSILGPSGCGKSTTLFMMAGIYESTGGDILFDGKSMNGVPPESRGIGMVFQNYALYPHMTVLQNIQFPLRMRKVPRKQATERAIEMAKLVQIDHLADRKPGQLSGGQQQRTAIARALARKPDLLLFDEPLSNLDARLRLEMREEIRRIQQELQVTTIFVTHDQEEAMSISDQVILMKDGVVQQYSPPQKMYDEPENLFVASFLGSPPINQLKGNISKGFISIAGTNQSIPVELATEEIDCIVAVRPESFYKAAKDEFHLTASVELVERIGRDMMAVVKLGEAVLRVFLSHEDEVQAGDEICLGIRKKGFHLFTPAGERIPFQASWYGHKR